MVFSLPAEETSPSLDATLRALTVLSNIWEMLQQAIKGTLYQGDP